MTDQVAKRDVLLATPRGFCAGVDRAIDIVSHALQKFGAPIYVRHEIVHNTFVVNDLKQKGAIFIEDLDEVPPGATLVFSAHGVSRAIQDEAKARGFSIFDATCPLVAKVHVEVAKLSKQGYEFLMIGHKGHPEVEGTMGQLSSGIHLVEDEADVERVQPRQTELLAVVTQTTLSVWMMRHRSWRLSKSASRMFANPSSRTFATPLKIGRMLSRFCRAKSMW